MYLPTIYPNKFINSGRWNMSRGKRWTAPWRIYTRRERRSGSDDRETIIFTVQQWLVSAATLRSRPRRESNGCWVGHPVCPANESVRHCAPVHHDARGRLDDRPQYIAFAKTTIAHTFLAIVRSLPSMAIHLTDTAVYVLGTGVVYAPLGCVGERPGTKSLLTSEDRC